LRPEGCDALIVNPLCWFSWRDPPPPGLSAPQLAEDCFAPADPVVWVVDPGTGALWPYWTGPDTKAWLERLVPGRPVPDRVPAEVRWVLINAHILVNRNHDTRARGEWLHNLRFRAGDFQRGFAIVPHLVPPMQLGALRRYYRCRTRTGSFRMGDGQVDRRYVAHNEPVARYVHEQLTRAMGQIACARVKPSYAYFVGYQSGASLERHIDRPQCEYSITLLIDFTPEPSEQSPWPIKLDARERTIGVWQYLGEALLYRGRQLPHHRDALPRGCSSSSLLLHYVDTNFVGSLN
jgi:hypothetical protein